jgi:hypothetical protein
MHNWRAPVRRNGGRVLIGDVRIVSPHPWEGDVNGDGVSPPGRLLG